MSLPQVLLTIAARFAPVMRKYETVAYTAILKDAGVLLQTMYLVATALGLAPCALGSGNVEDFASATGLDLLEVSSIAEFMLGSAAL
ncbi:MAG: nitroreductase family protein [Actinomycetota bacterium]|nr:nitroreductase family protein [Actinomycetota bacterium]